MKWCLGGLRAKLGEVNLFSVTQEAERETKALLAVREDAEERIYVIKPAKHGLWDFSYNVEFNI